MAIKNLVFQGGGVKGLAYVGVLAALEATGFNFQRVQRVAGTSAGAIIALAFALRLNSRELKEVLDDINFDLMLDHDRWRKEFHSVSNLRGSHGFFSGSYACVSGSTAVAGAASHLSKKLGLFPGLVLLDLFEKILCWKTGIRHCTFLELRDLGFTDLYVVGFNLNTQLETVFCADNTPHAIVSDAIRISMSIPFFFEPHPLYHKVNGRREKQNNDMWTDGGIIANYAIDMFDGDGPKEETLGFYLSKREKIDYLTGRTQNPPRRNLENLKDYSLAMERALRSKDYNELIKGNKNRTIFIDTVNIGTLDFNLSTHQKNDLLCSGWNSVCERYQSDRRDNFFEDLLCIEPPVSSRKTVLASKGEAFDINSQTWAIAMAHQADAPRNVFILIEAVYNPNNTRIFRYDYDCQHHIVRAHNRTGGDAQKLLSSILQERNTRSQCWKISCKAAEALMQRLNLEANLMSGPELNRGEQSQLIIYPDNWCQEKLHSVNNFQISGFLHKGIDVIEALKQKPQIFTEKNNESEICTSTFTRLRK